MKKTDIRYKLDKLDLNGTSEKKDIVVLQLTEDIGEHQRNVFKSLQAELQNLKNDASLKNVSFLVLPKHITIKHMTDKELDAMGLCRK